MNTLILGFIDPHLSIWLDLLVLGLLAVVLVRSRSRPEQEEAGKT